MKRTLIFTLLMFLTFLAAPTEAQEANRVMDVAWSPDGTLLAVASSSGVAVYDVMTESPRLKWMVATTQPANVVKFSPSGAWLAAGLGSGAELDVGFVNVWNSQSGALIANFEANTFAVLSLAFSPDGRRLATGGGYFPTRMGGDYAIRVWDTSTWTEIPGTDMRGTGQITSVGFSPDSRYLAFGSLDGAVNLLDGQTYDPLAVVHEEGANCIRFNEDSNQLILGFYRSVEVWELRTEPEIFLTRQTQWSNSTPTNITTFLQGEYMIGCDLEKFVTFADDGILRIRNVETGAVELTHSESSRRFTNTAFSPDYSRLALVSDTNASPFSEAYQADYRVETWTLGEASPVPVPLL